MGQYNLHGVYSDQVENFEFSAYHHELLMFKLGYKSSFDLFKTKLLEKISSTIQKEENKHFILLQREIGDTPIIHIKEILEREIADELGIEIVSIRQNRDLIDYSLLSKKQREELISDNFFSTENLRNFKGKNVILLDDVIYSGALSKKVIDIAYENGAASCYCIVMFLFESYRDFERNSFNLLNSKMLKHYFVSVKDNEAKLYHSSAKYIIRYLISLSPKKIENVLNLLIKNSVHIFHAHPVQELKTLNQLTKVILHAIDHNNEKKLYDLVFTICYLLFKRLKNFDNITQEGITKQLFPEIWNNQSIQRYMNKSNYTYSYHVDGGGALKTTYYNWGSMSTLFLFCFINGYTTISFDDRKIIKNEDYKSIFQNAQLTGYNICSPYLIGNEKASLSTKRRSLMKILFVDLITDFNIKKVKLKCNFSSQKYGGKVNNSKYSDLLIQTLKKICYRLSQTHSIFRLNPNRKFSVVVCGSVGRKEACFFSDYDINFFVKESSTIDYIRNIYGPLLYDVIRLFHIEITPVHNQKEEFRPNYAIKFLKLYNHEDQQLQKIKSVYRFFDYIFIWGDHTLFKNSIKVFSSEAIKLGCDDVLVDHTLKYKSLIDRREGHVDQIFLSLSHEIRYIHLKLFSMFYTLYQKERLFIHLKNDPDFIYDFLNRDIHEMSIYQYYTDHAFNNRDRIRLQELWSKRQTEITRLSIYEKKHMIKKSTTLFFGIISEISKELDRINSDNLNVTS